MKRREFIAALGGAAAWPVMPRAQPALPTIGFLNGASLADGIRGFHEGLRRTGYVEGENVAIIYRWAENQLDKLPVLAADLVRRRVAVIFAGTASAAQIVQSLTSTVPILFIAAEDPVKLGLVASLGRPAGNLTGVNFFAIEFAAKRLELLRELVPAANRIAVLVSCQQTG
jgi:putative ABC transport system substrate-binding protein